MKVKISAKKIEKFVKEQTMLFTKAVVNVAKLEDEEIDFVALGKRVGSFHFGITSVLHFLFEINADLISNCIDSAVKSIEKDLKKKE